MQVIWNAVDVIPGQRLGKQSTTERFIIGYEASTKPPLMCITSLEDGMIVTTAFDPEKLAKWLTDYHYQPVELLDRKRRPA